MEQFASKHSVNFLGIVAFPVLLSVWFALVSLLFYSRINCDLGSLQASHSARWPTGPLEPLSMGAVWSLWGQKWVWEAEKGLTLFIYEAQIYLQYINRYIV